MNSSSAIRFVKTEETVSHRQNIGVKEVGIQSELCESRGGHPGLPVLMSLMVSVDVKQH